MFGLPPRWKDRKRAKAMAATTLPREGPIAVSARYPRYPLGTLGTPGTLQVGAWSRYRKYSARYPRYPPSSLLVLVFGVGTLGTLEVAY
eukprot:1679538-Rhodomonas_salina.1